MYDPREKFIYLGHHASRSVASRMILQIKYKEHKFNISLLLTTISALRIGVGTGGFKAPAFRTL